jgi:hypothetical protein
MSFDFFVKGNKIRVSAGAPKIRVSEIESTTLSNGLLAFWPLNETTGQRLDISGNNRHLSDSDGEQLDVGVGNAVGSVVGKIGNAAEFTGDSGARVLRLGTPLPAYESPTGSISAWVKFNSVMGVVVVGDYYRTPLSIQYRGNENVSEVVGILSGATSFDLTHPVSTDVWYHIVFTYDQATGAAELFVNGVSVDTHTYDDYSPVEELGGFAVGSTGDGFSGHFIDGLVDAVGVWDRVLTTGEILQLYNQGAGIEAIH